MLADAIVEFVPKNSRERQEKTVILDYLSYITAQHMRARQRQIEYGSRKGRISLPEGETENPDDEIAGIFVLRNGHQTVVNLPDDADYEMVVTAPKKCDVIIYDILVSARKLRPEAHRSCSQRPVRKNTDCVS